jgi:ELWxxDGT repeat protein
LFKDINLLKGVGSFPSQFTILNNILFFTASDSSHGEQLWRTDGDSISMVKNTLNSIQNAFAYSRLMVFNNRLYFNASITGSTSSTLWTSDGTDKGTYELLSCDSTALANPVSFEIWRNKLIFIACRQYTLNNQLWISDGTNKNTRQIFPDSITGWNPFYDSQLISFKDDIYFTAKLNGIGGFYKLAIDTNHYTSSIDKGIINTGILIYPNPVSNILSIDFRNDASSKLIRIMDLNGKILFSKKSNSKIDKIDISNLEGGIYITKIDYSNKTYTKKIIKK